MSHSLRLSCFWKNRKKKLAPMTVMEFQPWICSAGEGHRLPVRPKLLWKKKMFSQQISAQQWIFILKASIFNPYPCVEKQSWMQASALKIAVERFLAKGSLGKEHRKKSKKKKKKKPHYHHQQPVKNPMRDWENEEKKNTSYKKYYLKSKPKSVGMCSTVANCEKQ